jgi:hypothetical protein
MLHCIKKISSYTGVSRFYGECYAKIAGYIPRQSDIPSPYAYSPAWEVLTRKKDKIFVVLVEVGHKRYEVFQVPPEMVKKREKDCY